MVYGAGIISWEYILLVQDSIVLCRDPLYKVITTIINKAKTMDKYIFGDDKLILYIIMVERVS